MEEKTCAERHAGVSERLREAISAAKICRFISVRETSRSTQIRMTELVTSTRRLSGARTHGSNCMGQTVTAVLE